MIRRYRSAEQIYEKIKQIDPNSTISLGFIRKTAHESPKVVTRTSGKKTYIDEVSFFAFLDDESEV